MTAEEKSRWWMQQMALWWIGGTLGLILGQSEALGYLLAAFCGLMVTASGVLTIGFAHDEKKEEEARRGG